MNNKTTVIILVIVLLAIGGVLLVGRGGGERKVEREQEVADSATRGGILGEVVLKRAAKFGESGELVVYTKDNKNYYKDGVAFAHADSPELKIFPNSLLYRNELLTAEETIYIHDPESLEYLGEGYLKDNAKVYNIRFKWRDVLVADANPATFAVFIGDDTYDTYWRRQHYVRIGEDIIFMDPGDHGIFPIEEKLPDTVDAATFEILQWPYARDKNRVYWGAKEVVGADPEDFRVMTISEVQSGEVVIRSEKVLGISNGKIYRDNVELVGLDIDNAKVIEKDYISDGTHVFYAPFHYDYTEITQKLEGADASSLNISDIWNALAHDDVHVYFFGELQPKLDGSTFEVLNGYFLKDKNHAFAIFSTGGCHGKRQIKEISEADGATFQLVRDGEYAVTAKDKNHVYSPFVGILEDIDPNTVEITPDGVIKDVNGEQGHEFIPC